MFTYRLYMYIQIKQVWEIIDVIIANDVLYGPHII